MQNYISAVDVDGICYLLRCGVDSLYMLHIALETGEASYGEYANAAQSIYEFLSQNVNQLQNMTNAILKGEGTAA